MFHDDERVASEVLSVAAVNHTTLMGLLAGLAAGCAAIAPLACGGAGDAPNEDTSATGSDAGANVADGTATRDGDDAGAAGDDAANETDGDDADGTGGVVRPKDGGAGFPGNYSSPTIVREGSVYHAWFAAQTFGGKHYNIPHATFTENGEWTVVGEALPHLGAQAFDGPGRYPVWAPAVARIAAGKWMLYYAAQVQGTTAKKCIWRAHATSPDGPFVDDYTGPIECSSDAHWSIDPYLVQDAQGTWHLAARIDEGTGINTIQIRALDADAAHYAAGSSWSTLTQNAPTSWEQPVLENAGVVRLAPPGGAPHWFVFYSGGAWSDNSYAVGYADCGASIDGPCTKKTPNGPWLATDASAGVFGPGTPTFYENAAGETLMSVQAWKYSGGTSNPKNDGQIMRTYRIAVDAAYTASATLLRVDE